MAKSFLDKIKNRHTGIENNIENINMEDETKEALKDLNENTNKQEIIQIKERIKNDKIMSDEDKNILVENLRDKYQELFNFENCPNDYLSLKEEAKFLAGMTQYSFILMAQRLQAIKLGELYKEDGYSDFKSFIESELEVSRQTVYKYIDILSFFGVATLRHEDIDYSKLIPIIPVLRNDSITTEEKETIKKEFIEKAKTESAREINKDVKELKIRYGMEKKVDEEDKEIKKIKDFIEYLKKKSKTHDGEKEVFKILESEIGEYFKRFGKQI